MCLFQFRFLLCQFSSVTQSCPNLFDPVDSSTTGLPVHHHSQSLPKLMYIELVIQSNHLILCLPLLLLPSIFPSIRVFSNESVLCIRWPKYWSFSSTISPQFSSVQFSRSVMSNSLRPHESQHARPPCPSPTPGVTQTHVRVIHPAISSSVIPFSSCPQSLPASESFPMSQLFA